MNITAWQKHMEQGADNTLVMDVAKESVKIFKVTNLRFLLRLDYFLGVRPP